MSFKKQKILKKTKENFLCNNYSIFCFLWHTRKCILFFGTRDSKIFKWQIKFNCNQIKNFEKQTITFTHLK